MDFSPEFLRDMRAAYSKDSLTSRIERDLADAEGYRKAGRLLRAEYKMNSAAAAKRLLNDLYGND